MNTRSQQRRDMDDHTRIVLIEGDTDELEGQVRGMQKVLYGILISTATAAILLALDLVVGRA
ncbi:hypothetical protein LCGC14_2320720 [marine sediment metagenome]|uniref:Uncharacterized protein n=1 Tax=marine sediment metagenome TaxID=412755 RepID=A0A0F9D5E5_9ZZZZ